MRGDGCNPFVFFFAWLLGAIPIGIAFDALGLPDWVSSFPVIAWTVFLLWWLLFRPSGGSGGAGTWKHGPDADGF